MLTFIRNYFNIPTYSDFVRLGVGFLSGVRCMLYYGQIVIICGVTGIRGSSLMGNLNVIVSSD